MQQADEWWRDAVIYQIYPKSWADSDGNGYGDAAGVRARLSYLSELGIDAIWFSPFYKSPDHDGGYDVADYRDIDPRFGTLAEVEGLVQDAHARGIKVLIDLVPNHTSSEHRFFTAALATAPGSPEWSRYHVLRGKGQNAELPPNNWRSVFSGEAWSPILSADGEPTGYWYLHLFDTTQPDVNWDNVDIQREFDDTIRFWLDRGIDGFRVDVAHGLVKMPGLPDSEDEVRILDTEGNVVDVVPPPFWDQPGVHDIYRRWRSIANEYEPARIFVGEIWAGTPARLAAYLRPDEMHTGFNFPFLLANFRGEELRTVIDESLKNDWAVGATTTWVIENHDVPRAVNRYAFNDRFLADASEEPGTRLESRILSTPLDEAAAHLGRDRARAAMLLMLALPGSTYIYQGQELSLDEVIEVPEVERQDPAWFRSGGTDGLRDGCRVPMPWTHTGSTFGFAPEGAHAWLTQPRRWAQLAVDVQEKDPESTLMLTRKALRLRHTEPALGEGAMRWRDDLGLGSEVLAFERPATDGGQGILAVTNTGDQPVEIPNAGYVLASSHMPLVRTAANSVIVPPACSVWLRIHI